ncbi:hypothetical protein G7046_g7701 [Stylonectria norvegica]|nr:hypothetical protein G7046_g7701 [Stylonectria norvegica]
MQLSPLQSRLAASLAASLMVLALYLLLFSPNFALAAELAPRSVVRFEPLALGDGTHLSYEPDFALFDRDIVGRAPPGVTALNNNAPDTRNLPPGTTICYMVDKSVIFGRDVTGGPGSEDRFSIEDNESRALQMLPRESTSKTIYLSANTCLQPDRASPDAPLTPPQLTVYVSNTSDITCPDASKGISKLQWNLFDEGAVMMNINATGDIYIGIAAPNITTNFTGVWNFEVAISFDDYYHRYEGNSSSDLLLMDSDSSSVLLVTKNMTEDQSQTQQIMSQVPPYSLFLENNKSSTIEGLRHSVCGLELHSQIMANRENLNGMAKTVMTTRGPGGLPKQQFYFMGLNASSSYSGILVKNVNDTSDRKRQAGSVGGGGTVFSPTQFSTLSGTNCKVVTDLEFCDEIQYAVPGNDDKFNNTELATVYDNYAKTMYANFEKVLAQIPCEAPAQSIYSLARTCDQCRTAYKRWLCTVSIPRCDDLMSNTSVGITRNMGQVFPNGTSISDALKAELGHDKPYFNASRNSFIDTTVQPGPYKEILPCEDICYEVVQACPAAMGFVCPQPRMPSFNASYGRRNGDNNAVTCNYPGEARTKISAAVSIVPGTILLGMLPLALWVVL